ncbi:MAG: Hydrolase SCO5215, alpha/beta fold family [uncultured Pseudonocardia sp.]|uniref:Hydrolase SCO5215, alpha/beta fold family n=1 Tax=uncultured Pseudonocardia sp. TaxID=211455 RepID=A0A6J4PBD7_9PSEU|nr:MAG: Hydrolase SCO5215, alpha/beta fold family [uncultured Pseudonocardia sp.]
MRRLSWQLEGSGIDLVVAPSLTDVAGPRIHIRPVSGLPLLHVEEPEFSGIRRFVKNTVDRTAALLGLVWLHRTRRTTVLTRFGERLGAATGVPLLFGGRSSGARVACRTATDGGARAVLCLAFPVHPPGREDQDRSAELAAPAVPVLVVQGERDPFGRPGPAPGREVVLLRGDHSLRSDLPGLRAAVTGWAQRLL